MQDRKDAYFKKAKREGYLARSAYKLLELNKKYNLIRKNSHVLDLGCSPGSWVQVSLKLGVSRVTGVDLNEAKVESEEFEFRHEDMNEIDIKKLGKFDVVLSDVAPSTSGYGDAEESVELSEKAWKIAKKVLRNKGNFVCKVFQGKGFEEFTRDVRKRFEFFKIAKPSASRSKSKEMYVVGKGFK
jgi:23S rRNA (uridine2552-2'-O)-methyltransferase